MSDYQERPNRSRDEFSREFDRRDETLSLREQLKKWGTAEEKKWVAEFERREEAAAEKKRKLRGDDPEKLEIVPNFSKHDVKRDW
jgi:uncharacterized protein YtpQ (UPF0354 family)